MKMTAHSYFICHFYCREILTLTNQLLYHVPVRSTNPFSPAFYFPYTLYNK